MSTVKQGEQSQQQFGTQQARPLVGGAHVGTQSELAIIDPASQLFSTQLVSNYSVSPRRSIVPRRGGVGWGGWVGQDIRHLFKSRWTCRCDWRYPQPSKRQLSSPGGKMKQGSWFLGYE